MLGGGSARALLSFRSAVIPLLVSSLLVPAPAQALYLECNADGGCLPMPTLAPPTTCAAENLPPGSVPLIVTGKVEGPSGEPIEGTCVYWEYASALTGADGTYEIRIVARTQPIVLYAYKRLYTWNAITITPDNYATVDKTFRLSFLHNTYVSPSAFNNNPPKTLDFWMLMTAPPEQSRVLLHLPGGGVLTLAQDVGYGNQSGWTRWTGTSTVASGTPDGRYYFRSCVLRSDATGNCDDPQGVVLSYVESPNARLSYVVDSVPPTLRAASPVPDHNTVNLRPPVSFSATDALSGIDYTRTSLWLDGAQVASGGTFYPPGDLSLGIHSVSGTAADQAGNPATLSWKFNVVSLIASPVSATVTPKTVLVNPNRSIPPPSWVYIDGAQTELPSFDLTLSSSALWSGTGTLSRSVTHSSLNVTFENELGQKVVVPAPAAYASFTYKVAVLEPLSQQLGVNLPAKSGVTSGIWVQIPSGFVVTDRSTATLAGGPQPSSHEVLPTVGGDPLPLAVDCGTSVTCTVTGVVTCEFASQSSQASYSCNGTYPRTTLEKTSASAPVDVLAVLGSLIDVDARLNSSTFGKYPIADCGASGSCPNAVDSSLPNFRLTAYWATGSVFRAYGYHYYYRIPSTNRLAAWQAADATPGSVGGRCSKLTEFGNSVQSTGDWQTSGLSFFAPTAGVYDQFFSDPWEDVILSQSSNGTLVYKVGGEGAGQNVNLSSVLFKGLLRGYYDGSLDKIITLGTPTDPPARLADAPSKGSYNLWHPSAPPNDYRSAHAEVMTGTEFTQGSSSDYSFSSRLFFKFDYQSSGC